MHHILLGEQPVAYILYDPTKPNPLVIIANNLIKIKKTRKVHQLAYSQIKKVNACDIATRQRIHTYTYIL